MKEKRPSWHEIFMEHALVASKRSTCLKYKTGAVLVLNNHIIATGYNGAPSKLKHCAATGCMQERKDVRPEERPGLCRAVHAEMNCLIQAAKHGHSVNGGYLYVNHPPCPICVKLMVNAGITRVYYSGDDLDKIASEILKEADVSLIKL